MKYLTLLSLIISGSIYAQGMSTIKADYRCELPGGGVAFKVQTATKKARVWLTDVGDNEGEELVMKSFSTSRCPGCFSFDAEFMRAPVRGRISNFLLTYEAYDSENSEWKVLLKDVKCVKAK